MSASNPWLERRVVNFAHGSLYMLGAYIGYSVAGHSNFWVALLVAPAIMALLQREVKKALALPQVREVFVNGGYDPLANTPEEARAFFAAEVKLYGDIVKRIGLKPE